MSRKLGEVLIQRGLIDADQLKRALDLQLIYGGHLGTCLVEHGLVDVDELGQVLSEQFRVGHADRERLLAIDPPVLAMIPSKLADRHQVVPFELVGRTLRVAIVDPRNLLALDEISFVSGHKVEAWVAPEILVQRALELHYGVPRKLRHITVSGQLAAGAPSPRIPRARATVAPSPAASPAPATAAAASSPEPGLAPDPAPGGASIAPAASVEPELAAVAPPVSESPAPPAPPEPARATRAPRVSRPLAPAASPTATRGAPAPIVTGGSAPARASSRSMPEPSEVAILGPREGFVEQARPRVHLQAERREGSEKHRSIDWIKYEKEGRQAWCELYSVPLEHEHFRHLGGVYVIWHAGRHPVIRVGQGYIKTELTTLRLDPRLEARNRESRLFVTWASVPRDERDRVERFLYDMLDPELRDQAPEVEPLAVNLPC
jgi:hypothetical protein